MFYATKQNKYIVEGTAFELDGVQYPAVWLNQATAEHKSKLGLVEVIATDAPADDRFYWVSEQLNGAELTYVNTPKELRAIQDQFQAQVKQQVYTLLQPTDYIDIRNLRDPEYKMDWMLWRESIRTYAKQVDLNIQKCADVDAVKVIIDSMQWPTDPDYVAPIEQPSVVGE